jgi:hypothetical protein
MNRSSSQKVKIRSKQTTMREGVVIGTEYARKWGYQYLIEVDHPVWGIESFWMTEAEVFRN